MFSSPSSSLPPEVILIILSFLPGKTLPKLRLVSKQFNSIISEPYLLHLHHKSALKSFSILTSFTSLRSSLTVDLKLFPFTKPQDTALATLTALTSFRTLTALRNSFTVVPNHKQPVTKQFLGDRVRVLSSNHQLLCFVSDKEHFLFDPINQKTLEIPKPSYFSSSPSNVISFGFVSSTLQYKLIRFFLPYNPICKFEVLNIKIIGKSYKHDIEISPWKTQEQQCPYLLQPYPPVQANGFIYWTTKDVSKIVSFSLEHEKFSFLPPPPCFEEKPNHELSLCGIRGKLWVISYNSLEPRMEIWMMNGYNGSSWVKTHHIGLKETLTRYYPSFPIKIHEIQSDFVIFQVLFPSRIKIYYKSKNEVVDFGELDEELQFCHYTDGLVSF